MALRAGRRVRALPDEDSYGEDDLSLGTLHQTQHRAAAGGDADAEQKHAADDEEEEDDNYAGICDAPFTSAHAFDDDEAGAEDGVDLATWATAAGALAHQLGALSLSASSASGASQLPPATTADAAAALLAARAGAPLSPSFARALAEELGETGGLRAGVAAPPLCLPDLYDNAFDEDEDEEDEEEDGYDYDEDEDDDDDCPTESVFRAERRLAWADRRAGIAALMLRRMQLEDEDYDDYEEGDEGGWEGDEGDEDAEADAAFDAFDAFDAVDGADDAALSSVDECAGG